MIGVIGFGRFGKLMTEHLARDFEVLVYDVGDKSAAIHQTGARAASLAEVCRQDIVILPVPISHLKDLLQTISPLLKKEALVVDVCSVKEYPVRWMTALLPDSVSILATHPMFGPDSAAESLDGSKIVLCKERIHPELYRKIKSYLASKGLIVIEATPREHDRQIAVSLALTHFIGRALSTFGATALEMDTEGYKRLLHILEVVENDTWQLFVDMHRYNPYARDQRKVFMDAVRKIDASLDG
ncbi:MAG: prephenate dehydrogenase/arogenate dehydrogenase family protein [Desulfobacterales bacterium]|nr:MAG: prephenate dehydrogenase/arogenate dehydrogenase family protein [Desulfobacterales bacterium]